MCFSSPAISCDATLRGDRLLCPAIFFNDTLVWKMLPYFNQLSRADPRRGLCSKDSLVVVAVRYLVFGWWGSTSFLVSK